ncbi:MAG TPA: SIMPL domain-containing protein, partial [Sporichthya sp.]|nr:SIMPL domain-containing protein [Sporichthya sp.]
PAVEPMPASDLPLKEDPAVLGTQAGMSSVPPAMAMPRPGNDGPNGFEVFQSLNVQLRNVGDAGATISDAAAAGGDATRINGVSFEFADSAGLLKDARDLAFANAKTKAEFCAGSQQVSVTSTVVWELT